MDESCKEGVKAELAWPAGAHRGRIVPSRDWRGRLLGKPDEKHANAETVPSSTVIASNS